VELEMTKKLSIAQERELVVWAQAGSRSAMQDLLEAHRPTMTRLARRMLRDGEDVSDAVQEAMLKAARAIQSFDSTRPFAPWLMRITSNCCVDLIRSASQRPDSLDAYDIPVADAGADVQCSTETAMLAEALEALGFRTKRYPFEGVDNLYARLGGAPCLASPADFPFLFVFGGPHLPQSRPTSNAADVGRPQNLKVWESKLLRSEASEITGCQAS